MRRCVALLALGMSSCVPGPPDLRVPADAPRAPAIVIDGAFDDWAGARVAATSRSTPASGADLVDVTTRHDESYVYFRLRFAGSVNLLGLGGRLSLIVNADDSRRSGAAIEDVPGADLIVDFSPYDTLGRPTQGVGVRLPGPGATVVRRDGYHLDVVSLPTHASREFEIRLARGRPLGATSGPSFTGGSFEAQVAVYDGPHRRVDGHRALVAKLGVPYRPAELPAQGTDPLARAEGTDVRVLQWNVADRGLVERPEHFRRILAAADADVLILDEVADDLDREGVARFLGSIDSTRARASWSFTRGGGGGYQRTVVASRNSVTALPPFERVAFPDSVVARLLAMVPAAARDRVRANLAEGVAAGAARVSVRGVDLVLVGLDLQSAGNDSASWQEARRRVEARLIVEALARSFRGSPGAPPTAFDGLIVAGDFNLVGTDAPLRTVRKAWGLRAAAPRQLDGRTAATWDGREGPFTPGRLDWFLHAGDLEPARAFVLDTRDLRPEWLRAHRLSSDDGPRASDHMPIVVDLRWRR